MPDTQLQYAQITKAIYYLCEHFTEQPSLSQLAAVVNLSPFHFQRLFSEWAGVSPKKFSQYLTVEYAKQLLRNERQSLLASSHTLGYSSASRLHDTFVNIEAMTPGEYKNGGRNLVINYSFVQTALGSVLVASTSKGVCLLFFCELESEALRIVEQQYPKALIVSQSDQFQRDALALFDADWHRLQQLKLHLKASPFQLKVWQALLHVPTAALLSYADIAAQINRPSAARAVGSAIGRNPVALVIPCHRVIQSSGFLGGYRWGLARKQALIGLEAARLHQNEPV